jgi:membrane dipeptidase
MGVHTVEDIASRVHAQAVIIDGLNVSSWSEDTFLQLAEGGLTAVNATIAVHETFRETMEEIARWQRMFERSERIIRPVRSVDDIHASKLDGRVGIILGFQSPDPIEKELALLSIFRELGVRIIQLTYNERNYAGDGCLEDTDCGLSRFGREMIGELNRLGILIDLSHVGYRSTLEAIEASRQPVAITHANPRSLCDHPRNKTDDQIRALAARGGVIGANIFPPFLSAGSEATVESLVDVIDYLVRVAGIDHVGIGTDFTEGRTREWFSWLLSGKSKRGEMMELEWPVVYPQGIRTAAEFPNITRGLLRRGYSEDDSRKILGGNFLRLFREVWS